MDYFIKLPSDTKQDLENDSHLIGTDNMFGVFWAGEGWKTLEMIITKKPELAEHVEIITEKGKKYSIPQFLEKIEKLQIRIQR